MLDATPNRGRWNEAEHLGMRRAHAKQWADAVLDFQRKYAICFAITLPIMHMHMHYKGGVRLNSPTPPLGLHFAAPFLLLFFPPFCFLFGVQIGAKMTS